VLTILLDENIDGYADYLSRFVFSSAWSDISSLLDVHIVTFEEAGLAKGTPEQPAAVCASTDRVVADHIDADRAGPSLGIRT
jgi:hypothetical protein